MKVFISWSEPRSKAVAEALYSWLPTIIQPVRPWMSEHDIDKGTRGLPAISRQLEETQFGIICLTPENLGAPWLLFEAGALSKSQEQARVWTFLYGLEHTDVRGPLAQFQHTRAEREDVKSLLRAINTAQGEPLITEQQLDTAFNRGWEEFEQQLQAIPAIEARAPERTVADMVKEILELARAQARRSEESLNEATLPLLFTYLKNADPDAADSVWSHVLRSSKANYIYNMIYGKDLERLYPTRVRASIKDLESNYGDKASSQRDQAPAIEGKEDQEEGSDVNSQRAEGPKGSKISARTSVARKKA